MKLWPWLIAATGIIIIAGRSKKFIRPLIGPITSPFGDRTNPVTGYLDFHNGIDIAAPTGTKIISPADGKVTSIYNNSLGGNQLIIKHANGFTSGYAHLNSYLVKTGDEVKQSDLIATVGKTGEATGPHLHFTLRDEKNNYVNPELYI